MSIKKRGISAFLWDFFGVFFNHGTTLIVTVFLARILEAKDFGLLGMVTVIVSMTQSLAHFGFGESLIQKPHTSQVQLSTMFFINLVIGSVMTLGLYFSAPVVAYFFKEAELVKITEVISFSFFFIATEIIQRAKLVKSLSFKSITISNLLSSIVSGGIAIILAYKGYGVMSLAYKTVIGFALRSLFYWVFSGWIPSFDFSIKSLNEHWSFGYKMYIYSLVYTFFYQIDTVFIGKVFGSISLGFYSRAKSLNMLLVKYSSESLSKVLFPVFSEIQKDKQLIISTSIKMLHILSFLIFLLMGILYVESEDIIVLLFTEKWMPSVIYFQVMVFYAYAFPISSVLGNIIQGLGNAKNYLKAEIIKKSFLVIVLITIIFNQFEIYTFLYLMIVVNFINTIVDMFFVKKEVDIRVFKMLGILFYYFIISAVVTFAILNFHFLNDFNRLWKLLNSTLLFTFFYLLLNILLKSKGLMTTKGVILDFIKK